MNNGCSTARQGLVCSNSRCYVTTHIKLTPSLSDPHLRWLDHGNFSFAEALAKRRSHGQTARSTATHDEIERFVGLAQQWRAASVQASPRENLQTSQHGRRRESRTRYKCHDRSLRDWAHEYYREKVVSCSLNIPFLHVLLT